MFLGFSRCSHCPPEVLCIHVADEVTSGIPNMGPGWGGGRGGAGRKGRGLRATGSLPLCHE